MKKCQKILSTVLVMAIFLCSVAATVRAVSTEEFEAALEKMKKYDYGQSREPLSTVADMVNVAYDTPQSEVFADKMAAMLETNVSYACKDFLCRQLVVIGTDKQVDSLGML
jgi:hypothetical protein